MQFGIVTLFHFIFVPLTIGLSTFTAWFQTRYYRTGDEKYRRMTRFWGKLMLISFAVGVVTGIVQEFQFGMNWSQYSRYVGDVFGAPLAIEGLAAFFVESTFLGLWIFGWDKLSPKLHLATIWLTALGTFASAYFILAANSWMQHPVGFKFNPASGRAEMTSILDVLTNSTALYAFSHTILGALATGGMVVLGISAWHLRRGRETEGDAKFEAFKSSARTALVVTCAAAFLTATIGHFQGILMENQQPMKMAAAEALWETDTGVGLSVFATGDFERNPGHTNVNWKIPYMLSLLSANNPNAKVRGIDEVDAEYDQRFGKGDYVPIVAITYWSFRAMIGAGMAMILLTLAGLILLRRGMLEQSRRYLWLLAPAAALPFIANLTGWIFTEMGRQPWVVQGLLKTSDAVSPNVSAAEVATTLVGYTVIYGGLALVAGRLFARIAAAGPKDETPSDDGRSALAIAY